MNKGGKMKEPTDSPIRPGWLHFDGGEWTEGFWAGVTVLFIIEVMVFLFYTFITEVR